MISLYGMMLSTTENLYEEEIWSKLSDYVSDDHDRMLFFVEDPLIQLTKMKRIVTSFLI